MTELSIPLAQQVCGVADEAYTMPARYYTDPEIFKQEQEKIFAHSWICVLHRSQVSQPNQFATVNVAGEEILVVRGRDGVLRGFYNVCPHRAHELLKGCGKSKNVITCPYHAWTFSLDGKLVHARNCENVVTFHKEDNGLTPVQVEEFCGLVFVNLDADAPSLKSQASGLEQEIRTRCPNVDTLVPAHRLTYEMKANWKVVVDNYLECYHCAVAHPAFVESVQMETYQHQVADIYTSQVGQTRPSGRSFAYDENASYTEFAGFWLWPNVTLNVLPGKDAYGVFYMVPVDAETTIQHFEFYFPNPEPTEEQMALIDYYKSTLKPEDLSIVESVQRGLHSRGYRQGRGRLLVDSGRTAISEHGIHHFHQMVVNALAE